jgi:hypothetical protein
MNKNLKLLLALAFASACYLVSTPTHAGAGYRFLVTNKMTPLASDPSYPRVHVHRAGGSNCWYLNDIAYWSEYAVPGDVEKNQYTERKNSGSCNELFTHTAMTDVAIFIQANPSAPWLRLGTRSVLFNMMNLDNGFYIDPPLPVSGLFPICGLKVNSIASVINSSIPGTNLAQITVSGTPKLDNCSDAYAIPAVQANSASNNGAQSVPAVQTATTPDNQRVIHLKVGEHKSIDLSGLDDDSLWELDGGRCTGDAGLTSDLVAPHAKYRVLPQLVKVTATGKGEKICDLSAYHYPERTFLTTQRFIFQVR